MRAALTALLLLFSARQAVAFTDCCCDSFCRKPNEPCERQAPPADDCCTGESRAPEPRPCTHLAPSSEVVKAEALDAPALPSDAIVLPGSPGPAVPPAGGRADRPDSCSRGSPPLHLKHHVLLI